VTTLVIEDNGRKERQRHIPRDDGRVDIVREIMTKGAGWKTVGHDTVDSVTVTDD